jgi:5,6,7,8-tetrahydromethanopterin hydro-lyase
VGHDEVVLPALAGGCSGMILASAQVFPDIWQQVLAAVLRGDLSTARALQLDVQKLARIFCRHGGGVAVKAALNMMGIAVGGPRRPLMKQGGVLINEVRAEIHMELQKLGKVIADKDEGEPPQVALVERFAELGLPAEVLRDAGVRLGSGAAGRQSERVQIDLVAGSKEGTLGEAYALQLTYPRQGKEALTTILEPNLTIRPATLIVPTRQLRNLRQANMIYGPVQSAVGVAIADALASDLIPAAAWDEEVILAQVTLSHRALDRHAVFGNTHQAMSQALAQAYGGQ